MCLCSCVHGDTKTSDSIYKKTCVRRKTKWEQNWVGIHQCGEVNRGELFRAEYTGRGELPGRIFYKMVSHPLVTSVYDT